MVAHMTRKEQQEFNKKMEARKQFEKEEFGKNLLGLKLPEVENFSDLKAKEVLNEVESQKLKERIDLLKKKIFSHNDLVPFHITEQYNLKYGDLLAQKRCKEMQLSDKIFEKNDKFSSGLKQPWELQREIEWINFEIKKIKHEAGTWGINLE